MIWFFTIVMLSPIPPVAGHKVTVKVEDFATYDKCNEAKAEFLKATPPMMKILSEGCSKR